MSIFDDFDNWYIPAPRKRSDGDGKVVSSEKIKQPISRQIFDAASRGNIAKVTTLLENNQHEDVHILVNGLNVFHVVSKKGYVELIDLLLAYDPSLFRSRSTDQRDAFMLASFEGRLNVLQVLRSYERETFDDITNDEAVDDNGNSSLHYAAWGGHVECVRFLVEECGKDINIVNNDQISPLQYAAAGNHTPVVEYLSIISHSKSDESISGISPLHRAAAYGSYECLVAFIEQYHCEVESRTQNNSTALHFAAQHGHKEIVEYLCEHAKAMVDPENSYGVTPLQFACMG
jgi:ankyrin repeat protein